MLSATSDSETSSMLRHSSPKTFFPTYNILNVHIAYDMRYTVKVQGYLLSKYFHQVDDVAPLHNFDNLINLYWNDENDYIANSTKRFTWLRKPKIQIPISTTYVPIEYILC